MATVTRLSKTDQLPPPSPAKSRRKIWRRTKWGLGVLVALLVISGAGLIYGFAKGIGYGIEYQDARYHLALIANLEANVLPVEGQMYIASLALNRARNLQGNESLPKKVSAVVYGTHWNKNLRDVYPDFSAMRAKFTNPQGRAKWEQSLMAADAAILEGMKIDNIPLYGYFAKLPPGYTFFHSFKEVAQKQAFEKANRVQCDKHYEYKQYRVEFCRPIRSERL